MAQQKIVAHAIIPARYASTRFPGKPLVILRGKPMFWHVWNRASQCTAITSATLATDDERIVEAAKNYNVPCVMTGSNHSSGTDRVYEAASLLSLPEDAIIVNIQGDEPAIDPRALHTLIAAFADTSIKAATLARVISCDVASSFDVVKVVCAANGDALYFSRAFIPHQRSNGGMPASVLGHMGIYAFTMHTLQTFVQLPPSSLELLESLEQLRLLENGIPLRVLCTEYPSPGVDSPEDIEKILPFLTKG